MTPLAALIFFLMSVVGGQCSDVRVGFESNLPDIDIVAISSGDNKVMVQLPEIVEQEIVLNFWAGIDGLTPFASARVTEVTDSGYRVTTPGGSRCE